MCGGIRQGATRIPPGSFLPPESSIAQRVIDRIAMMLIFARSPFREILSLPARCVVRPVMWRSGSGLHRG